MSEAPLLPRNTTGIGFVAILLTAFTGAVGFLAQKAIYLDEQVVRLQEQQRDDEAIDIIVQEHKEQIANIESEQRNRIKVIDLALELDERMNRIEAHYEDLSAEVGRLRDTR